ncbi:nucleoside-diphosphate kinase [Persicimonas caeni]|uniref:Nucleoside diphosphate kinase n=1 Tax=Persicimonas caeni TaxID=2292766 RepID=A0A4Y6Q370_PERCE|nr:nucleoside-diphosphate kinase [Persicimonas caeni]QDG54455.1 nucleoside-diphosphate kinase [Persicimonas caeni]QED35676.1 nucleoside-diphosphate kinase [Persicimonas caeni]
MAVETTLSILKPDALEKNKIGDIINRFEEAGLTPVGLRMVHLSQNEAEQFYAVHKERPFFGELTEFMTRGPVVVMALRGENAIERNREIMGATNPDEADEGTIRADLATSIGENTVHGSDSPENAEIEVNFFFSGTQLFDR